MAETAGSFRGGTISDAVKKSSADLELHKRFGMRLEASGIMEGE
jgi:hypothetical protein